MSKLLKRKEKGLYVNVRKGNIPLIITAPHGGLVKPDEIPTRLRPGSLLLADLYTLDIAKGIESYMHSQNRNIKPYMVLNLLSRSKVDANRSLEEGSESKLGEEVWKEYHSSVKECIDDVLKHFNYAILIDIHGHTHPEQLVELGYLMSSEEIESDRSGLLALNKSSVKSLMRRLPIEFESANALKLFGDMLTDSVISVTPSTKIPIPPKHYFSGGFTTLHYHNYKEKLDVIQVEIPKHIRFDKDNQLHFIRVIGDALINMLREYYLIKARI